MIKVMDARNVGKWVVYRDGKMIIHEKTKDKKGKKIEEYEFKVLKRFFDSKFSKNSEKIQA